MDAELVERADELLKSSIRSDLSNDFCRVARMQLVEKYSKFKSSGEAKMDASFPPEYLKLICLENAVDCATALLKGETGWEVDVNVTLEGGMSPLQLAAKSLSSGMIKLFLMYGADPNVCQDDDLEKFPLTLALNALSLQEFVSDWTLGKSVLKLLYIFCLPELRESLAAVQILASRTKKIEMISLRCVEEGKTIQLGALLLVAWHKLMVPYTGESVEHHSIGRCISEQRQLWLELSLKMKDFAYTKGGRSVSLSQCTTEVESAEKLLLVLEKGRDQLELYRSRQKDTESHRLPFEVARWLSNRAGVMVEPDDVYSDDVKCLMPRLNEDDKDWLYEEIQKQKGPQIVAASSVWNNDASGAMLGQRLFHTSQALNVDFRKDVKAQLNAAIKVGQTPVSRFLPSVKLCSRLVLAARRCIK